MLIFVLCRDDIYSPNRDRTYQYREIEADREIRLFTFKRTKEPDNICINVKKVPIDDLPPFECISYTWGGKDAVRRTIICNGYSLTITENLWLALRRISGRVGRERRFWADQITINQNDLKEKSAQVAMMSKIFPSATRVSKPKHK